MLGHLFESTPIDSQSTGVQYDSTLYQLYSAPIVSQDNERSFSTREDAKMGYSPCDWGIDFSLEMIIFSDESGCWLLANLGENPRYDRIPDDIYVL